MIFAILYVLGAVGCIAAGLYAYDVWDRAVARSYSAYNYHEITTAMIACAGFFAFPIINIFVGVITAVMAKDIEDKIK